MCMVDFDRAHDYCYFGTQVQKARKLHRCHECGRQIQPGEPYRRDTGINDGFWASKCCQHCWAAQDLLVQKCKGFVFSECRGDLEEHIDPSIEWAMKAARLVVGMRRKWKKFKSDELMEVINFEKN